MKVKIFVSVIVTVVWIRPMQQALDKLKDVPVDIQPIFPLAK